MTGEKSINGDFLTNIKINYDYNHQNGTHREVFKIKGIEVSDYEENGYCTKLVQKVIKDDNSLGEILANPALLTLPKNWVNQFEYAFPALTSLVLNISLGQAIQIHVLYPETENRTKTFILLFGKFKHPILTSLLKNSFLKGAGTVVEQDTKAIESLYPREKPKIRLPNEEIMLILAKLVTFNAIKIIETPPSKRLNYNHFFFSLSSEFSASVAVEKITASVAF